MPSSSYFFNAISFTKNPDEFTQGEIDKDYKPYVINKMVGQYRDLVLFANEMNIRKDISKIDQMLFYMEVIPKKKRRALWSSSKKDENVEVIMDYYNITQEKAHPYLKILTDNEISILKDRLNKGGRN